MNYPEDVVIYDNTLYILNMGSNQLYKLDLNTKELNIYYKFKEPIWEYRQLNGQERICKIK